MNKNRTGIIDYGMGNLHSVQNALNFIGADSVITSEKAVLSDCDRLILPGVGAFPDAMENLEKLGLVEFIRAETKKGKPLLGICLGMQLLFDKSFEFRETAGLSLIGGEVLRLTAADTDRKYKIPHMGWNKLIFPQDSPLMENVPAQSYVYFVHSFAAKAEDKNLIAYCEYGERITAAVARQNVFGTQFHPEKSEKVGLRMLKNFCGMK